MYFWLNYCDENHVERIPIAVKNIDHLFHLGSERLGADRLHLLSDGTRIDENEYLESLEKATGLIVRTEEDPETIYLF